MKTTLITLMIALFAVAGFGQTATPPDGDGTETTPYQIDDLNNLYWITQNSGEWGAFYIQTANIDASETYGWDNDSGFSPIGNYNTNFTGSYDGQGHVIDSLFINRPVTDNIGLFGYVSDTEAKIQQIGASNANITGKNYTGSLVGSLFEGTVNNCYSTGSIYAEGYRAGGLIGQIINASVDNCYSKSDINGQNMTGGLAGLIWTDGVLANSYSTGSVSGNDDCGGLVGRNKGTVENSFWDTLTSGQHTSAGGTGKTTDELKNICMYTTEGSWDFMDETENGTNDYWGMNSEKNEGYPFLSWQGFTNAGDEIQPAVITKDTLLFLDETGLALLTEEDVIESASDNCGLNDTTLSQLTFGCEDAGEVTIDVTVTDKNGNDTTGQSVITVEDTIIPSLSVRNTIVYLDKSGNYQLKPNDVITEAWDNCSIKDTIIEGKMKFSCTDIDSAFTLEVTLKDNADSITTKTSIVTVEDTIKPILSTKNITASLDNNGQASITASEIVTDASDNCTIADTLLSQTEFTNDDVGEVTVNITVEDGSSNTATKNAIITVNAEETGIHTIAGQEVEIYPNPANGFVYIDTQIKSLQVKIINLNGKKIYRDFLDKTSNKININSFPSGLYILQIEKEGDIINHKLMIE